jgi:hypothetical protein
MAPKFYFFGCYKDIGHYLRKPGGMTEWDIDTATPWGTSLDSKLCPKDENDRSWVLTQKDGWSTISAWDNTIDKRGKSNANFVAEGLYSLEEMKELAKANFPELMGRFKF